MIRLCQVGVRNQQILDIAKLLQYSGSRVEHRDGFSSYKRFAVKSKMVNLVLGFQVWVKTGELDGAD